MSLLSNDIIQRATSEAELCRISFEYFFKHYVKVKYEGREIPADEMIRIEVNAYKKWVSLTKYNGRI